MKETSDNSVGEMIPSTQICSSFWLWNQKVKRGNVLKEWIKMNMSFDTDARTRAKRLLIWSVERVKGVLVEYSGWQHYHWNLRSKNTCSLLWIEQFLWFHLPPVIRLICFLHFAFLLRICHESHVTQTDIQSLTLWGLGLSFLIFSSTFSLWSSLVAGTLDPETFSLLWLCLSFGAPSVPLCILCNQW